GLHGRDLQGGHRGSLFRTDRGVAQPGSQQLADCPPRRPAASPAHSGAAAGQRVHRHAQGHLAAVCSLGQGHHPARQGVPGLHLRGLPALQHGGRHVHSPDADGLEPRQDCRAPLTLDPVISSMSPATHAASGDDLHEGPTAEIDVGALSHNLRTIRSLLAPATKVLAAVKANAYGHGLVGTAGELRRLGVDWFGVAAPSEALELRGAGVTGGVLLLTPVYRPATIAALVENDVALVVTDETSLAAIVAALPQRLANPAKLHLKIDTGMGRLGLGWAEASGVARLVDSEPRTVLEGVWTHLASSGDADRSYTLQQLDAFHKGVAAIRSDGIDPGLRHVANSAAVLAYPEHHCEMVRPGIVLYGYYPDEGMESMAPGLRPVMRLSAPVTFVKRVVAGTHISYDGLWTAH